MTKYGKFVDGKVQLYSAPIDPETGKRLPKSDAELAAEGGKKVLCDRSARPERGKFPRNTYSEEGDYIVEKLVWFDREEKA
jgi:hypothetical protein